MPAIYLHRQFVEVGGLMSYEISRAFAALAVSDIDLERRDIDLNEIVRETIELLSRWAYVRETDVSVQLVSREL